MDFSGLPIELVVGGAFVVISVVGAIFLARKKGASAEVPASPSEAPSAAAPAPGLSAPPPDDLAKRLHRTRGALAGLGALFGGPAKRQLAVQEWEQLEEALLGGDVGMATSTLLLERVKERAKVSESVSLRSLIQEESERILSSTTQPVFATAPKPLVISVVGVNGVGKTTTIGKLAKRFSGEGKVVLLGAVDTFRAAAIGQLKIWADRSGAQFVTGREGADPGAVAFDAVAAGKARGVDMVLLDTAGRLHTKSNLMEELKKVHRVIKKVIPEAPHETWLVVDGTLGQNSIQQAREFQKTLELTGIVVTKLDGTAKGGAVLAIASELKLPIRYIGVGESAEDLIPFEPKPFVEAILGESRA